MDDGIGESKNEEQHKEQLRILFELFEEVPFLGFLRGFLVNTDGKQLRQFLGMIFVFPERRKFSHRLTIYFMESYKEKLLLSGIKQLRCVSLNLRIV